MNNSEWEKVENWTSVKWGVIYFSHADTRTKVPKKITKMQWTLNLAKPAGAACLTGLFNTFVQRCCGVICQKLFVKVKIVG